MMRHTGKRPPLINLCFPVLLGVLVAALAFPQIGASEEPAAGWVKHQKTGLTCQGCHQEVPPAGAVPDARCVACHGGLPERTAKGGKAGVDPHASPHLNPGEQPRCDECHHIHKPSVVSCHDCHSDLAFGQP
jgi:fumarate reductase flavoprotein subunit